MNVVCLVGRLIADPELRQTPQGTSVCSFTVSVQRPNAKKDSSGYYPSDLIRCVAWRTTGEFVSNYFVKGNMIGISGAIQVNQYTDRDTGKKLSAFEVLANNVYFVESKNANNTGNGNTNIYGQPTDYGYTPVNDDAGDLPF